MNYPLVSSSGTLIYNVSQLCAHLVQTYHEACHEKDELRIIYLCQRFGITEYTPPPTTPPTTEELRAEKVSQATVDLASSDASTVRVLEDLVELLCKKNHIQLTELPAAAQDKLAKRKEYRMIVAAADGVTVEEETSYSSNSLWTTIKSWFGF